MLAAVGSPSSSKSKAADGGWSRSGEGEGDDTGKVDDCIRCEAAVCERTVWYANGTLMCTVARGEASVASCVGRVREGKDKPHKRWAQANGTPERTV
jgi:hypothetical protein